MLIASLICALALGGSACSNPSELGNPDVVSVEGVRVTPQTIHFVAIGETSQLSAALFPANATDRAIVWESTDSTVATVDALGRVTARAAGVDVLITAYTHDGHYQSSANVSVNP
jgi:uncharacterized protein YjdB